MALMNFLGWFLFIGLVGSVVWVARWLQLRWWPGLGLRLLLYSLIGLVLFLSFNQEKRSTYPPEILILDRSDSIEPDQRYESQIFGMVWQSLKPNRQVIAFGETADYILSEEWPEIKSFGSNLNQALEMADSVLGAQSGRIIIATDGNSDDPAELEKWTGPLNTRRDVLDFILLDGVEYASDFYLEDIRSISNVWSGMRFPVLLPVHAAKSGEAILQVYVNGDLYNQDSVNLVEGETFLPVMLAAGNPGVMQIEARLLVEEDRFLGNNTIYKSVRVYAQPNILMVTNNQDSVAELVSQLKEQNSEVTVISPKEIPTSIEDLRSYQVIILHDLLAQDLNYEQMQALKIHVLELGKGLVFIGGRNSYTLGGYQNTLLEPLMPIILAPPDRVQRVPITFLLVLDRSGSMAGDRDSEIAPIDLTREAAMRAIETLRSEDYLGVVTFSGTTSWDVDIRRVGEGLDLRMAQDRVSQIIAVGGTFMYQALEEAINAMLVTETTDYPHILLMSDGVSNDGSLDEFDRLVQTARSSGITISTIALGYESDPKTLSRIAEGGGGRFYQVFNPSDLPRVMISESRAVQAENVQEGRTNLILGIENHPILAGFRLDELPLLNGYIATQSKSNFGAEDVLVSGNYGDPLLSVWQVGLGHVAAWMGDLGEQWNPEMRVWDKQGHLWHQLARYTLPDPSSRAADVKIVFENTQMFVQLSMAKNTVSNLRWIQTEVGGQFQSYQMQQVNAGEYQLILPKPVPGAYTGIIQYSDQSRDQEILVPFEVNYPEEWRFKESGQGADRVNEWQVFSEGSILSFNQELEASKNFEKREKFDWYELLLSIFLVSWMIEIAIRRWKMPWRRP